VVLVGTCDSGYRTLIIREACEASESETYDAQGRVVYLSSGPYGGPLDICHRDDVSFGDFGIGASDPATRCDCCVLTSDGNGDGSAAGAGGTPSVCYPEANSYPACPALNGE
jgi:hypothetical protein